MCAHSPSKMNDELSDFLKVYRLQKCKMVAWRCGCARNITVDVHLFFSTLYNIFIIVNCFVAFNNKKYSFTLE